MEDLLDLPEDARDGFVTVECPFEGQMIVLTYWLTSDGEWLLMDEKME